MMIFIVKMGTYTRKCPGQKQEKEKIGGRLCVHPYKSVSDDLYNDEDETWKQIRYSLYVRFSAFYLEMLHFN